LFGVFSCILTQSIIWSSFYFSILIYLIFIFSSILYLASNVQTFTRYQIKSNHTSFLFISGTDLLLLLATPLFLMLLLNYSWTSPVILSWFGHLIFNAFQLKINYLIGIVFLYVWVVYATSFYFASQEIYDYTIVTYSFFLWLLLLFTANNIFTVIFFIELLSTLIMLLLITSVFSSTYFYNNLSLTNHSYFNQSTPFAFLQTLMFFFWISLVSSLNLFIFLILFYIKFVTLDWFTLEVVFSYVVSNSDLRGLFFISLIWLSFLFCLFLKCGVVPFFFWKPIFFKGMSFHSLFFYITFFYFFIFLFFIYFLLFYLTDLFYFNLSINLIMLMTGVIMLIFIMCESYYLKAFFAISSILNTLLMFLAMISYSTCDFLFIL
jgi:hypothetical protein